MVDRRPDRSTAARPVEGWLGLGATHEPIVFVDAARGRLPAQVVVYRAAHTLIAGDVETTTRRPTGC